MDPPAPSSVATGGAGPEKGGSRPIRLQVVCTDLGPASRAAGEARAGEGDRTEPAVLLLHGNPTWAYLYRHVLGALEPEVRCVAPDYPGFGRTRRPSGYGCRPQEHAAAVEALVRRLHLQRMVIVGHDWGGPIGLAVAAAAPGRVEGLVLSNTWGWRPDLPMWLFSVAMGGRWPGRWLQLHRNFFVRRVLPAGMRSVDRRDRDRLAPYRAPFPTPESRLGTWVFPRAVRTEARWVRRVRRDALRRLQAPVELVWGMRDPALGRERVLNRWRGMVPSAGVDRVEDAAHYVPEDRPGRIVAAVRRILGGGT